MKHMITEGQDSFLDIVANLVGILIILVVLVGANASQRSIAIESDVDQELEQQLDQLKGAVKKESDHADKLFMDNRQLEKQIEEQNRLAAALSDRRHQLLVRVETVKRETAKLEQQLSTELAKFDQQEQQRQQQTIALANAEQDLIDRLSDIQSKTTAVAASVVPTELEKLTHYPNPIAKTVFTKEIHFRLDQGRLAWVPLEELIDQMKGQWRVKAEALQTADLTTETVGPIDGFRLQYQLRAADSGPPGRGGRAIRFDRFRVIPQPGLAAETVEQALSEGSEFRRALSEFEPNQTTVSVWVYPDGFDDHRRVKAWLYENGYQMASWPLEFGRHISGGPNGFKTSAQ